VAIALLLLQLGGTFMPLVFLPEVTFQPGDACPGSPSMEGQYIIKNLLILSAALVVGGTVRGRGPRAGAAQPERAARTERAVEAASAPEPASAPPHARPAPTDHPIEPLIGYRWSPRAFDPRPVEPELLCSLFEAARWAPSSFNDQPWFFMVATRETPEWHERLGGFLHEGNAWARRAPVLVASAHRTVLTRNGKPNRVAARDLGAAEENLCLQAFASGLVVHQMAGFDRERLAAELLPDEDHAPCCMIAIGYPGDPALLSEKLREREGRERRREPLSEFVFGERWGQRADFVPQG
jgi:nitroreductase